MSSLSSHPAPCPRLLALVAGGLAAVTAPLHGQAQTVAFEARPLAAWRFDVWPVEGAGAHPVAMLPDGTIAVGSALGVKRFDGRRLHEIALPAGVSAAMFLHVDRAGVLHAVDGRAVHVGVAAHEHWTFGGGQGRPAGEGGKGPEPTSICEDRFGAVWVGHRDGLVSRTVGRGLEWLPTATAATTAADAPAHVAADQEGRVWMARKGCLAVWDDTAWRPVLELATGPLTIAASRAGGLWLRVGAPLYRYEPARGLARVFADIVPTIRALREDDQAWLWIGTSRYGLLAWDGAQLRAAPTTGRSIVASISDGRGGVWAGTNAGLEHGRPRIVRRLEMPTIKPLRMVQTAADGTLWFLTLDGDLGVRPPEGRQPVAVEAGGQSGVFSTIAVDRDGTLWAGTRDGGIVRFAGSDPTRAENLAAPSEWRGLPVTALAAAHGGIWAAFGQNLAWTDGERWLQAPTPASESTADLTLLVADETGGVWAAGGGGLWAAAAPLPDATALVVTARTPPDYPAAAVVTAICPRADGGVWMATRSHGLWRLGDGQWTQIDRSRGLPSATLLAALPDDHGRMWCVGDRLFFAADCAELEAVAEGQAEWVHCWVVSGENDLAFFDPAVVPPGIATRDPDGRPLVVLPTGLAVCEPTLLPPAAPAPEICIAEVRGDGRRLDRPRDAGYALPAATRVAVPADARVVSCMLAETGFATPANARIQHRLEGIDSGWIDTPADRVVAYDRLPAGRHALRLRSSTTRDVWQSDQGGLIIEVEPWLWERPWFRVAIVVGAALLTAAGVYARQAFVSSLAIARVRQAAALDRERVRIARDMHDELGTSLTQISLLTELIRSRVDADTSAQLEGVTTIARDTVASLDEIVWAVNPQHDTLAHLLSYVTLYASQALGRLEIKCRVELPESLPPRMVPAEFRRAVLAIVKEAVGNVIRHAGATTVDVQVAVIDDRLAMTIADDGRGPAPSGADGRPRAAAGLDNMRQRARDLGGTCEVGGRPGGGMVVRLDLPLPTA